MHIRSIRIENAHHPRVNAIFAPIIRSQRLRAPLTLIITRANTNRIDISPILLNLRMHQRIAINLTRRRMKNLRLSLHRELQHIHHTDNTRLHRLNRIMLIMHRRRGTSKIVNLIKLPPKRLSNIMKNETKATIIKNIINILPSPRKKIIKRSHLITISEQPATKMTTEKPSATSNQSLFR